MHIDEIERGADRIAGVTTGVFDLFAAPPPPAAGAHDYRDKNFDYFVVGDPKVPRAAQPYFIPPERRDVPHPSRLTLLPNRPTGASGAD
jgi:hypothetical protein